MSPMLHVPILGNWNYWDLHTGMASVVYVVAGLGVLASVSGRDGLLKFAGWAEVALILLTLLAVYLKVSDSFSLSRSKNWPKPQPVWLNTDGWAGHCWLPDLLL